MNEAVGATLRDLVHRRGLDEVTTDAGRLRAMLRDLHPEDRAEVAVLVAAAEEGVPWRLQESATPALQIDTLAQNLADQRGLSADAARWGVVTWLSAVAGDTAPPTPPTPPTPPPPPPPERPRWLVWAGAALAAVVGVAVIAALGDGDPDGNGTRTGTTVTESDRPSPSASPSPSPTLTPSSSPSPSPSVSRSPERTVDDIVFLTANDVEAAAARERRRVELANDTPGLTGIQGELGAIWFAIPPSWQGRARSDPELPYDYLYAATDVDAWEAEHDPAGTYFLARRSVNTIGLGIVAFQYGAGRSVADTRDVISGTQLPSNCVDAVRREWRPGDLVGWRLTGSCADGMLRYGYAQLFHPDRPNIVVELEYVDPGGGLDPDPFNTASVDLAILD